MVTIPQVDYAIIGGSSTYSLDFPGDLDFPSLQILETDLSFETPYGPSPPFTLFTLEKEKILTCKFHGFRGWKSMVTRADSSRQIFWVFSQAKVKRILSEGGVGAINELLKPRDIIIPHDYLDFSNRRDVDLNMGFLLSMRRALCPFLREILVMKAEETKRRVFHRGRYLVTDGRHFESETEIRFFSGHADIVGQSLSPEVYLAREIGACYAGVYLVVNYGEGVIEEWKHDLLKELFYGEEGKEMGMILLKTIKESLENPDRKCDCSSHRHPTMLK